MKTEHPLYIISKGRWETRMTSKALEAMGILYHIVVEPQELEQYASVIDRAKILVLPFSNLGQGSIPARNWVWEHAIKRGASHHWILDDNISGFGRYNRNKRTTCTSSGIFRAIESFQARYTNVALSGMNYRFFVVACDKRPPITINTRIYSCILIRNDIPYRWRGRYNEDTDLSLRVLKDGWCTLLFNAFFCNKMATMTMKGGNTESLYLLNNQKDGRLLMAQSLLNQHSDVTTVRRRWGRWQHHVDYSKFRRNKLVLRPEFVGAKMEPDEFGMQLVKLNG